MRREKETKSCNTTVESSAESNNITYGWVCPKCGKVNAPWKDHCDCTESYDPWKYWSEWWKYPYYPYYPYSPYTPYVWCSNKVDDKTKINEASADLNTKLTPNSDENWTTSCTCNCCDNHKDKENK